MDLAAELESARTFRDVFAVVKAAVAATAGRARHGLRVGFSELGLAPWGFVGAYHPVGTDLIVMNKTLLRAIGRQQPHAMRSYAFHLLLHEYLHALGVLDEAATRALAYHISLAVLGGDHPATHIARSGKAMDFRSEIEQIAPLDPQEKWSEWP